MFIRGQCQTVTHLAPPGISISIADLRQSHPCQSIDPTPKPATLPAPAPSESAAMRHLLAITTLVTLASPALAADGDRKAFKDWEAGNRLDGTSWLRTFAPGKGEDGAAQPGIDLLRRSDETEAFSVVIVWSKPLDHSKAVTLVVDGESIPVKPGAMLARDMPEALAVQDQAALDRIAPKLKNGHSITVEATEKTGKPVKFDISLSGLAAAMLWLDDQQGRAGKPEKFLPLDPSLTATTPEDLGYKVSVALPPEKDWPEGWRGLPKVLLEKNAARGGCGVMAPGQSNFSWEAQRFDPVITIYSLSCTAGAYNFGSRFWSVRNGDFTGAEVLTFADTDGAGGWTGIDVIINPSFDWRKGELTSFSKSRGIGDCGSTGIWKWDGYTFKLQEMRAEDTCNGKTADQWPVVFRARKKG